MKEGTWAFKLFNCRNCPQEVQLSISCQHCRMSFVFMPCSQKTGSSQWIFMKHTSCPHFPSTWRLGWLVHMCPHQGAGHLHQTTLLAHITLLNHIMNLRAPQHYSFSLIENTYLPVNTICGACYGLLALMAMKYSILK